jgi:sterol desaturase/sphingolipid hydroxylase (fatty acid hydroxylase superfamily)
MRYLLSIACYLAILTGSVWAGLELFELDKLTFLAAPVPIVAASLVLLVIQRLFAFRDDWRDWSRSLGVDLLHFVFSSGAISAVAKLSVVTAAWLFASWVESALQVALWPDGWPLAVQIVLAVLLADFGSYWIHRWAHDAEWFWKFHSVHHSSERMYVFAAGRNHPFNVFMTYAGHTLPLALLGAGAPVLLGVTVFTAVHGMLQHANINFSLGVFNYVFAGPELHRRHHSVVEEEAYSNFGSNLSVWDLVFGTLRIPTAEERTRDVGIPFLDVKRNFFTQLLAPFRYQRHIRISEDCEESSIDATSKPPTQEQPA